MSCSFTLYGDVRAAAAAAAAADAAGAVQQRVARLVALERVLCAVVFDGLAGRRYARTLVVRFVERLCGACDAAARVLRARLADVLTASSAGDDDDGATVRTRFATLLCRAYAASAWRALEGVLGVARARDALRSLCATQAACADAIFGAGLVHGGDSQLGAARALCHYLMVHRVRLWPSVVWRSKRAPTPVVVAGRPSEWLALDVGRTVRALAEHERDFWLSEDLDDALAADTVAASVVSADTAFFAARLAAALAGAAPGALTRVTDALAAMRVADLCALAEHLSESRLWRDVVEPVCRAAAGAGVRALDALVCASPDWDQLLFRVAFCANGAASAQQVLSGALTQQRELRQWLLGDAAVAPPTDGAAAAVRADTESFAALRAHVAAAGTPAADRERADTCEVALAACRLAWLALNRREHEETLARIGSSYAAELRSRIAPGTDAGGRRRRRERSPRSSSSDSDPLDRMRRLRDDRRGSSSSSSSSSVSSASASASLARHAYGAAWCAAVLDGFASRWVRHSQP